MVYNFTEASQLFGGKNDSSQYLNKVRCSLWPDGYVTSQNKQDVDPVQKGRETSLPSVHAGGRSTELNFVVKREVLREF